MNKIRRTIERVAIWLGRTLRTIFVVIWDILLAIAILVLLIVAVLTTAVEKFFALLSSLSAALLGKIGKHLLGAK